MALLKIGAHTCHRREPRRDRCIESLKFPLAPLPSQLDIGYFTPYFTWCYVDAWQGDWT